MPPPLYAARVSDLLPGRTIVVTCVRCSHSAIIPSGRFTETLPAYTLILDAGKRCRCRNCGTLGMTSLDPFKALGFKS